MRKRSVDNRAKTLEYYLARTYPVEMTRQGDLRVAHIPILPGCEVRNESRVEALALLDEAKAVWLSAAFERGDPIPEPRNICE